MDGSIVLSISPEGKEALEEIIRTYGPDAQIDVAVEEMSELTQALCKLKRSRKEGKGSKEREDNAIEEMADVQIMLMQMELLLDKEGEFEKQVNYKIERQLNRIQAIKDAQKNGPTVYKSSVDRVLYDLTYQEGEYGEDDVAVVGWNNALAQVKKCIDAISGSTEEKK